MSQHITVVIVRLDTHRLFHKILTNLTSDTILPLNFITEPDVKRMTNLTMEGYILGIVSR